METTRKNRVAPRRDPLGWKGLHFIFTTLGRQAIGSAWPTLLPEEMRAALEKTSSGHGVLDTSGTAAGGPRIDMPKSELARIFFYPVALYIAAAARAGLLRTAYAKEGGGELTLVPPAWWRTDDPMLRFKTWRIDPEREFSEAEDLPCWIFVHFDDFFALANELREWHNSLPDIRDLHPDELSRPMGDPIDCIADGTAVSVFRHPNKELWFIAPWLPNPEQGVGPISAGDRHSLRLVTPERSSVVSINPPAPVGEKPASVPSALELMTKKPPHRPSKTIGILAIFASRLREGTVHQDRGREVGVIVGRWSGESPPARNTVRDRLSPYYRKSRWDGGKLQNLKDILAAVEADKADLEKR